MQRTLSPTSFCLLNKKIRIKQSNLSSKNYSNEDYNYCHFLSLRHPFSTVFLIGLLHPSDLKSSRYLSLALSVSLLLFFFFIFLSKTATSIFSRPLRNLMAVLLSVKFLYAFSEIHSKPTHYRRNKS